jgi:hypothetical protein
VELTIDGERRRHRLTDGQAEVEARTLAAPGRHVLGVDVGGRGPVRVEGVVVYGVPWDRAPERAGPFALQIEGDAGARDEIAGLELVVVNRSPRWIASPELEIELPTGAELTEVEHARIRARVRRSEIGGATVTMSLRPLAPGATARIPLPVRWSLAGVVRGLGVAGWAADRPDAISVLPPRAIRIGRGAR